MMITDEMIEAAALSDAEFDGRNFVCMGRVDRDRYMLRAKASLTAALSASPAGVGVETEAHKALKAWEAWEAKLIMEGSDQLWCELGDLSELQALRNAALTKEATHD